MYSCSWFGLALPESRQPTISSAMQTAETAFRYAFAMLQAADDTDANLTSAFANFVSARTMVCAGFAGLALLLALAFRRRAVPR